MKPTSNDNIRVRNLSKKRAAAKARSVKRVRRRGLHHLPANLTREEQWETGHGNPQMQSTRMFVAMLILFLVFISGMVGFHFWGHDPSSSMLTKDTSKNVSAQNAADKIPTPAVPKSSNLSSAISPSGYHEHLVRTNETWESIAHSRNISLQQLHDANPGVDCHVGRKLRIPNAHRSIRAGSEPDQPQKFPVTFIEGKQGSAINRYVRNPETLELTLPGVTDPAENSNPTGAASTRQPAPKPTKGAFHTVGKGETIYSIAKRHRVSTTALLKVNNLQDAGKLRPGQKLKLPQQG